MVYNQIIQLSALKMSWVWKAILDLLFWFTQDFGDKDVAHAEHLSFLLLLLFAQLIWIFGKYI